MAKTRGRRPQPVEGTVATIPTVATDHNKDTPKFCLRHLQSGFDVGNLSRDGQASFAMALQKRASMTWLEIIQANRHGLGSENIPRSAIKARIPPHFADAEQFLVLRYDGRKPMAGVRTGAIFHILWIECEFNELYAHS
ncbi:MULTISPECIES: hypothetical protein [unclassified Saccharothrix]|uniref:hypothetical protein n=1 Tax=unclassified Saccharothrix TaxID=2593673 RepID=UPI00307D8C96